MMGIVSRRRRVQRSTMVACVLTSGILLAGGSSCGWRDFAARLGLLEEFPDGVGFLLDNAETFTVEDPDVRATIPGTIVDPPELLSGCWGRVETEMYAGWPGEEDVSVFEADFL